MRFHLSWTLLRHLLGMKTWKLSKSSFYDGRFELEESLSKECGRVLGSTLYAVQLRSGKKYQTLKKRRHVEVSLNKYEPFLTQSINFP